MKFFTALAFIAISSLVQAQIDFSIENISCPSGGNLISFDLTVTDNGIPVNTMGSFAFVLEDDMGNDLLGSFIGTSDISIDNLPINGTLSTFPINITCDDVIGTNVTAEVEEAGSVSYRFSKSFPNFGVGPVTGPAPDPIPTLGEWALIVLSLIILVVGLVRLRSTEEALS